MTTKNHNSAISHLLFVFTIIFLAISCAENSSLYDETIPEAVSLPEGENIESASLEEKLAYKELHLTNLVLDILKVNPEFTKSEGFKASKGERPALYMENLLKSGKFYSKDDEHGSLEAFLNLDGEDWYPILTKLKDGDNDGTNALYLLNTYDPVAEREFVKAFGMDESGNIQLVDEDYTEEDFNSLNNKSTRSAYAMSLAQCKPTHKNQKAADCNSGGSSGGSNGGGSNGVGSTANVPVPLEIKRLKIMDKKESWLEKADVYIYGYAMSDDVNFFSPLGFWWGDRATENGAKIRNNPEYKLGKYSNSDVKNGRSKTINKHMMNGTDGASSTFISYVIYEYDGFPAPLKQVRFSRPGGTSAVFSYRSYNQKYIAAQVTAANSFDPSPNYYVLKGFGNTVKNSVIEYNFSPNN